MCIEIDPNLSYNLIPCFNQHVSMLAHIFTLHQNDFLCFKLSHEVITSFKITTSSQLPSQHLVRVVTQKSWCDSTTTTSTKNIESAVQHSDQLQNIFSVSFMHAVPFTLTRHTTLCYCSPLPSTLLSSITQGSTQLKFLCLEINMQSQIFSSCFRFASKEKI